MVAGASDGSVVVWDTNQNPKTRIIEESPLSFISPSFSTANLFGDTHLCSVVQVKTISSQLSIYSNETRSMGDYFVSMDEAGTVIFWLVIFLSQQ